MMMAFSSTFFVIFLVQFRIFNAQGQEKQKFNNHGNGPKETPLLLVLSFDGLRADFLNPVLTPNLWNLSREGVFAPHGIKPQVVTVTATNYFSISTGLHPENHGIIGNTFYDPDFQQTYDYWKLEDVEIARRSRESKWYSGEPIWQTNEKMSNRKSGAMRWPLCDAPVNNVAMSRCTPWEDYGDLPSWMNDMNQLLSWFQDKKQPINLGFLYISEPDHTFHENDIYSPNVRKKLAELDLIIFHLIKRLETPELKNRLNIIFVADHGHVNVYNQHNTINLDEILDPGDYIWSSKSIFPNTRRGVKADDLYKKLEQFRFRAPKFDLWWKEEVPEKYHFRNNKRIGPIVLMEHLGYEFASNLRRDSIAKRSVYGSHGFSNDYFEMRPAFFAVGPAFKKNLKIDWEIENVDLYNLMAAVLETEPAKNDGNFTRVYPLLKNSYFDISTKTPISGASLSFGFIRILNFACQFFVIALSYRFLFY